MDDSAAAALQGGGPGIALHRSVEDVIGKDTVAFVVTENLHHAGAGARHLAGLLEVGEGEEPVFPDGPTHHATVLMAFQLGLGAVEVVDRVQFLVAIELEESSMEAIRSRLSHGIHHRTGKLSVLCG